MRAKISKISGNTAVIIVDSLYAYLVDTTLLPFAKVGYEFDIDSFPAIIETATSYGIDLDIICQNGISIDPLVIQSKLYSMGVVSLEDLKKDPSVINRVLISMVGVISANLYKDIKISMEDYNV